jgi:hypothetical protein
VVVFEPDKKESFERFDSTETGGEMLERLDRMQKNGVWSKICGTTARGPTTIHETSICPKRLSRKYS